MADDNDDEVGYGKPPKHGQFKPGTSANPRGRPRGALGLKAELKAELDEFVTITVDGKPKRIRKRRLVIKALAAKAAKGNVAAADKLLSLVIQAEGFEDERPIQKALTDTDNLILSQFLKDGEEIPTPEPDPDPEAGREPINDPKPEDSE
jgi:hypothetical protein